MEKIIEKAIKTYSQLNETYIQLSDEDFLSASVYLFKEKSAKLRVMFGKDCRETEGVFKVYAVFSISGDDQLFVLYQCIDKDTPKFTSITSRVPAAHWYEREIRDFFGIDPEGHPDKRRLVFNEYFPKNSYPLRKDWTIKEDELKNWGECEKIIEPYEFMKVDGEGVYEIPVGPVHAGIIEPGHFRFSAVGETIFFLEAKLFYTHKGTEKLFEKKSFSEGVLLSERVSGTSSVAHSLAYIQAVERMSGITVPHKAQAVRTILLELERLYNHVGDVGNTCAGTGLVVGNAMGAYLKELLMQLNEKITGSRYLRGANIIGGVNIDLFEQKDVIIETLDAMEKAFRKYTDFLLNTISHLERLENTGKLAKDIVLLLGGTGIAAKASNVFDDVRKELPHLLYKELDFRVTTDERCDVLARIVVRIEEAFESMKMIKEVLNRNYGKEIKLEKVSIKPNREAFGYTESPRGAVFYYVSSNEEGGIDRVKIRSSSYCNWPLMPFAVHGNIVPDFPLCNKSFNLSYSGTDM